MNGYIHGNVNHSENFVDPNTGVHTQGLERAWLDAKDWYKSARGNMKYLQSHLDEVSWRKLRAHHKHQNTLFTAFLQDLRNSFTVDEVVVYPPDSDKRCTRGLKVIKLTAGGSC